MWLRWVCVCSVPNQEIILVFRKPMGMLALVLAPQLLPVLWQYLNLLDKEPEGIQELVGGISTACGGMFITLLCLAVE